MNYEGKRKENEENSGLKHRLRKLDLNKLTAYHSFALTFCDRFTDMSNIKQNQKYYMWENFLRFVEDEIIRRIGEDCELELPGYLHAPL
jgi:hypothetical protein